MRFKKTLAAGAVAIAVATVFPAMAATTADTTVTFAVTATDGLNISAPTDATLSSAAPGNNATGPLGTVTVNDQRSQLNSTWTATASLPTAFTTGGGTANETIGGGNVTYAPGTEINPVNGPFTAGATGTLASARTAFSRTSGSGDNSVSWNPTLTVAVPASNVSGTYTGTVRHSVA